MAAPPSTYAVHGEGAGGSATVRAGTETIAFDELSYEMRITTTETQHRVDLVHRNLRSYGTVFNTLAEVCDVHGTVVAVAPR